MSEHLWMYEGVTEYFAIFSNQSRINPWRRILFAHGRKIENANGLNDTMPFTTMSANVLTEPYKAILELRKGALIGMCIDIIIREKKWWKRNSWFDAKLSIEYGVAKPFDDADLFLQK
jgi:predicted metalloprotease with PDZ domain